MPLPDWKTLPALDIAASLESGIDGLSPAEASRRYRTYGPNQNKRQSKRRALTSLLANFRSPLVLVLLFASLLAFAVGDQINSAIIAAMVLFSVLLNFVQEYKSNKAAEKIAATLATLAAVVRGGQKSEIDLAQIVPGDIIILSAGDMIPADGRLLFSDDFFVNEAALTGESFPVEKPAKGAKDEVSPPVYAGTNVVSGSATMIAVKTGANTEYGQIAQTLAGRPESNAFELGVKSFGYLIIKLVVFIVLIITFINLARHKDLIDTFLFAIAVAVGLTPELLPMIMSINMAKGSIRMAEKGVIVKRLNAIPDFGSLDILCTDKTGTLTQDKITVIKHLDPLGRESDKLLRLAYLNSRLETGLKSMMDKAILDHQEFPLAHIEKIDEIPYDFDRKRLSIILAENQQCLMVTKGAPEEIFKICSRYDGGAKEMALAASALANIKTIYDQLSSDGYRVLAVAAKPVSRAETYAQSEEADMCFCGFLAFYDPPKPGAGEVLNAMANYGIEVKILSGDSPLVVRKICQKLKFPVRGVIVGDDGRLDKMTDEALGVKAEKTNVFARLSPHQKERIISVLKNRGQVVGYLGDGINDAPALKAADVGISVENAVDVAKETADIILVRKSLQELLDGVIEGRKTFGNTIKYILMGLSSNFGNMFSMIGAALYLPFFPMTASQILLNNSLYDISQVAIPSDKVDPEYLQKPKHWDIKFIKKFMFIFGPLSTIFDLLTFYLLFAVFHLRESAFQTGWFLESLATQVFIVYIIRTKKIPFLQSGPGKYLIIFTFGVVLTGFFIAQSRLGAYFGFSPLPWPILIVIITIVIAYMLIVESAKQMFYRKFQSK